MATRLETRRRRATVTHLRTKRTLMNALKLFWVAIVLWCEVGAFFWSLVGCRWPDQGLSAVAPTTHVLLIADPQILDKSSYPGRPRWLMSLTQHIVDLNLRKSWNAVLTKLDPHVVVFLGDMMDSGRGTMNEHEYDRYYTRFKSIFQLDRSIPVHYLPGNHDVNLGHQSGLASHARDRYQAHFGALNQRVDISNHTFLLLDSPGLVDEDYRRHNAQLDFHDWSGIEGGTVQYLRNFTQHRPGGPIVLLSHIPLFRRDRTSCGPRRERGTIRPGVGPGYQNLLLRETSAFVLENVRPSLIFSGDDHDYCEYTHNLADGSLVREVTVKSFSMAMGIQRPGFQLLSLGNTSTSSSPPLADTSCLLPNQVKIYKQIYAALAVITILLLLGLNHAHRQSHWTGHSSPWFTSDSPVTHRPSKSAISLESNPGSVESYLDDADLEDEKNSLLTEETDEAYHLPTLDTYSPSSLEKKRTAWHTPQGRRRVSSTAIPALLRPSLTWWPGGRKRTWYGRAARDLCQIAWLPIGVYLAMSLWLSWR